MTADLTGTILDFQSIVLHCGADPKIDAIDDAIAALRRLRDASGGIRRGGLAPWQVKRVVDFMLEHIDEDLSLADISQKIGLSRYHFARAFRSSMGLAPRSWLTERRIEKARLLMVERPEMPLVEVALSVGYMSQAAFGVAFRRRTGVSPAVWRLSAASSDTTSTTDVAAGS